MANYGSKRSSCILPYKGKSWGPKKQNKRPAGSKRANKILQGKKKMGKGVTPSNAIKKIYLTCNQQF